MALNARSKKKVASDFLLFDVIYEDGALSSNRKVPAEEVIGVEDKDDAVKAFLEAQDRKIGEASGNPRGAIKTVLRVERSAPPKI